MVCARQLVMGWGNMKENEDPILFVAKKKGCLPLLQRSAQEWVLTG